MKLYHFPVAPNPSRVRIFVNEKAIPLEQVPVNLTKGEHKSPEHLARTPRAVLPVLELEDGSYLTESVPIMEYLEEQFPEPPLIGKTALERARTREAERMIEFKVFSPVVRLVHATNSPLGLPANPAVAESEQARLTDGFAAIEEHLGRHQYAAGDAVSMADCTLCAGLFFGEFFGVTIPEEYEHLRRWYELFKVRPSVQA